MGSDLTGRLRSLRVSSGTVAMGTGSGDIYQRAYTWKADQVVRIDTCLLGAAVPRTETYSYDRTLRLTEAGRPAGNFDATGGAFESRAYGYDGRGNRTTMSGDGATYGMSYADWPRGGRLMGWSSSATGSLLGYSLAYDVDGRVTRKEGARKQHFANSSSSSAEQVVSRRLDAARRPSRPQWARTGRAGCSASVSARAR